MFTTIDRFLPDDVFDELKAHRMKSTFAPAQCPEDGVTYPGIQSDLPDSVVEAVQERMESKPERLFLRESPQGVHVPHIVHHDLLMGNVSMMVYLDDPPEGVMAGTGFWRHRYLGVCYAPVLGAITDLVRGDMNRLSSWDLMSFCKAKANRACIFPAGYFHSACPIGGYGEGVGARCVLTGFFA